MLAELRIPFLKELFWKLLTLIEFNKSITRPMSYCKAIQNMQAADRKALHANYHDHHYGFPIHDDNALFGRLILEINQAGLSWETILRKEEAFKEAYSHYDIDKVASYTEEDRERLLSDAGIIRNRLKINAAIENAQKIQVLQKEYGSFENG
jgi:DNA-3-methyladenine glycosylase I